MSCVHFSSQCLIYNAQVMMDFLKEWETKLAIKITCSQVILQCAAPIIPQKYVFHHMQQTYEPVT